MNKNCAIAVIGLVGVLSIAADDKPRSFVFSKDQEGTVPAGWKAAQTGKGESVWKVVADDTTPSKTGYALAQTTDNRDALFNLCVANELSLKDVEVAVAFKAIRGKKDQGGGIVWRYQDANNYYIARVNPLEGNYRLYKVVAGKRVQLETEEDVKADEGKWHTMTIKMSGDHIECRLNGKKLLEAKDDTIQKAGKVGLWTKADAQTHFDDFRVSGK